MSTNDPDPYGAPVPPPPPGPSDPYGQNPYGQGSYGQQAPAGPTKRPGRVTAAAITTLVASGLTLVGLLVSLLFITSNRDAFIEQIDTEMAGNAAYDDLSSGTLADVSLGFLVVLAVWCVIALVLALMVLRGSGGARIALVVSASLSALVSLLGALVIVPLLLTVASIVVIVLLLGGGAGDWFAARKRQT